MEEDGKAVPDWDSASEMLEQEYRDLVKQEYVLIKHGNLRKDDLVYMPSLERRLWIEFMNEEREKEEQARKRSSGGGKRPPSLPS